MIVYKLLSRKRDGSLGSLYINRKHRLTVGEWEYAEAHPTSGYANRPGWHTTSEPVAPHIKMKPDREWWRVEIDNFYEFKRPKGQGGVWYIAKAMRLLEKV